MLQEELELNQDREMLRNEAISNKINQMKRNISQKDDKIYKLKSSNYILYTLLFIIILGIIANYLGFFNNTALSNDDILNKEFVKLQPTKGSETSYFIFGKVSSYKDALAFQEKIRQMEIEVPYLIVSNKGEDIFIKKIDNTQ